MKTTFSLLLVASAAFALNAPTAFAADAPKAPTVPFAAPAAAKVLKYEATTLNSSAAWIHRDTVLVTAGQPALQIQWAALDPCTRVIHAFVSSVAGTPAEKVFASAALNGASHQPTAHGALAPPGLRTAGFAALDASSYRFGGAGHGATIVAAGLTLVS